MTDHLVVLTEQRVIGRVEQRRNAQLALIYEEDWREDEASWPLSLSLSLVSAEHGDAAVRAFLMGLLPDNDRVLESWGRKYGVSPRNPFALIRYVGEDCAGAAQFVRPDRMDALLTSTSDSIDWIDNAEVARRLRDVRQDSSATRQARDAGQFSLAGAQPKIALFLEDGRWGVPSGRTPTTHILKPPLGDFDGFAENEHFCLEVARAAGLPVAKSRIERFGDEVAFVTERYDRERHADQVVRFHQEDTCQSLAVPPTSKYENEGGPGLGDVAGLLRDYSQAAREDIDTLIAAVAYNWIIGGTDAHAKNYSIIIGSGTAVRLAPLYDMISMLPYDKSRLHEIRLAMKIGGEYGILRIGRRQWEKAAKTIGERPDAVIAAVEGLVSRVPDALSSAAQVLKAEGLHHAVIDQLSESIAARSAACMAALRP